MRQLNKLTKINQRDVTKMKCQICGSKKVIKKYSNFPVYMDKTSYDIFECHSCDTQFIETKNIDKKIYEIIYSQEDTPGYDRYFKYMKEIKKQKNPLKYLYQKESIYFPVYEYLKDKPKLKILEVGCGNGYLSYSLNFLGHSVIGIDISKEAIKLATSQFGNYFVASDLKDYKTDVKFDLIISTEVIEHIQNPNKFISHCVNLLKDTGKILLTTPNKDYQNKKAIWKTESPPVHTFWFSKKSFKTIAKKYGLNYKFVNPQKPISCSQNKLSCFILSRNNRLPLPILDKNGKPFQEREKISNSFFRVIARKFLDWTPIRYTSNLFMIKSEPPHLGVLLGKKFR